MRPSVPPARGPDVAPAAGPPPPDGGDGILPGQVMTVLMYSYLRRHDHRSLGWSAALVVVFGAITMRLCNRK
ncbi:hypothetical protein ACH4M4_11675 [Streptomyces sp. NPDC017254]|uniref:hypothetical protein n=1 Tax=unclassified Streptomyces TaxID=2593676 RepID=UPI003798FC7F